MVTVEVTAKLTLTSQEILDIMNVNTTFLKEIDNMMKKTFGEEKKV